MAELNSPDRAPRPSLDSGTLFPSSSQTAVSTRRREAQARLSTAMTLIVALPLLLAGMALVMGVLARGAVLSSAREQARQAFARQGEHVIATTRECLEQSYPLMDVLRAFRGDKRAHPSNSEAASFFRSLMVGRRAISYLSCSETDGHFYGVEFMADKTYHLVDCSIQEDGSTLRREFSISADGRLVLLRSDPTTNYDPRKRPFWKLASESSGPVWTEPYAFWDSGLPGVTCTQAVRDRSGKLTSVLTVDFHVNELSRFLEGLEATPGGSVFLFTGQKQVVAHPTVELRRSHGRKGRGELLELDALGDAPLAAFAAKLPALEGMKEALQFSFEVEGEEHLAQVMPYELTDGVTWYVGAIAPSAAFLAPARNELVTAASVGVIALLVAIALSFLIARHVARSHARTLTAQEEVAAANRQLAEMGSYRLVRRLGAGNMGEVWLAEHRLLARPAAIKLIPRSLLARGDANQDVTRRFRREARATASLESVHTIRLYDFGVSADDRLFYVMELLDGLDLAELVERFGPAPPARVARILRMICSSLVEAHEKGLVHRDIKPANVYLCRQGAELDVVKVLDFGLVTQQADPEDQKLTQEGALLGSPAFMAPEQTRGEPVTAATDLYALGCVGFWLLTGAAPFDGRTLMETLAAHRETPPPFLRDRCDAEVPAALESQLRTCLAKAPADRPRDARELLEALDAIEQSLSGEWTAADREVWWTDYLPLVQDASRLDPKSGRLERRDLENETSPSQAPSVGASTPSERKLEATNTAFLLFRSEDDD